MSKIFDTKDHQSAACRELTVARYFGGVLSTVGLFILRHGGLSLLGLFSFDRAMDRQLGRTPQSKEEMMTEFLAGCALLLGGLAVYIKALREKKTLGASSHNEPTLAD